jgi:hypothetical protein
MTKEIVTLSRADIAELREFLRESRSRRLGESLPGSNERTPQASDVYVVQVPCGKTIPAMVDNVPGHRQCCLYRLVTDDIHDPTSYEFEPIRRPDDQNYVIDVYNIHDVAAYDEKHWQVYKDKHGRWLVEKPTPRSSAETTTTTSYDPGYGDPLCNTDTPCKWVWDGECRRWELVSGSCSDNPPPSTSSTSSTTTTTCECQEPTTSTTTTTTTSGGSTTSSTSSTTTTTEDTSPQCECAYPLFCGETDGECTFTRCVKGRTDNPECSRDECSSTTTDTTTTFDTGSCDCETTTTQEPTPDCAEGCDWATAPGLGWHLVSNGCASRCACGSPPYDLAGTACLTWHTSCYIPPPTTTPPPFCVGGCEWFCSADLEWTWRNHWCAWEGVDNCWCDHPGNPCTECATWTWTSCYVHANDSTTTDTTTTEDPCAAYCDGRSTTTDTTTTEDGTGCDRECFYKSNAEGTDWELETDNCGACACGDPPADPPQDTCEKVPVGCGGTTTTSSTTTTTTTSADNCCSRIPDVFTLTSDTLAVPLTKQSDYFWLFEAEDCGDYVSVAVICYPDNPNSDIDPTPCEDRFDVYINFPCKSESGTDVNILNCDCGLVDGYEAPVVLEWAEDYTIGDLDQCSDDCTSTTTTTTTSPPPRPCSESTCYMKWTDNLYWYPYINLCDLGCECPDPLFTPEGAYNGEVRPFPCGGDPTTAPPTTSTTTNTTTTEAGTTTSSTTTPSTTTPAGTTTSTTTSSTTTATTTSGMDCGVCDWYWNESTMSGTYEWQIFTASCSCGGCVPPAFNGNFPGEFAITPCA